MVAFLGLCWFSETDLLQFIPTSSHILVVQIIFCGFRDRYVGEEQSEVSSDILGGISSDYIISAIIPTSLLAFYVAYPTWCQISLLLIPNALFDAYPLFSQLCQSGRDPVRPTSFPSKDNLALMCWDSPFSFFRIGKFLASIESNGIHIPDWSLPSVPRPSPRQQFLLEASHLPVVARQSTCPSSRFQCFQVAVDDPAPISS